MDDRFSHWQKVYEKAETEFSWYQSYPYTSLKLIVESKTRLDDPIIDIGGGDSHLADELLRLGYTNISVLDISQRAIDRAKARLGELADRIKWIVADVINFRSSEPFAVWHDRATFHFLIEDSNVGDYRNNVSQSVKSNGRFILGAFAETGPSKCSGLPVRQYSEHRMIRTFEGTFKKDRCFAETHRTPFQTDQTFQFCVFTRT